MAASTNSGYNRLVTSSGAILVARQGACAAPAIDQALFVAQRVLDFRSAGSTTSRGDNSGSTA
jgi:hypothetical protein